jgi:hypothetical protein
MVGVVEMLRIQSCDWSTRFMKVILLGLSLVSTNFRFYSTDVQVLDYSINVQ